MRENRRAPRFIHPFQASARSIDERTGRQQRRGLAYGSARQVLSALDVRLRSGAGLYFDVGPGRSFHQPASRTRRSPADVMSAPARWCLNEPRHRPGRLRATRSPRLSALAWAASLGPLRLGPLRLGLAAPWARCALGPVRLGPGAPWPGAPWAATPWRLSRCTWVRCALGRELARVFHVERVPVAARHRAGQSAADDGVEDAIEILG